MAKFEFIISQWMADHWKVDPCYAESGVDGSNCSFQRYLSEVERWCPALSVSKIAKKAITRVWNLFYNLNYLDIKDFVYVSNGGPTAKNDNVPYGNIS